MNEVDTKFLISSETANGLLEGCLCIDVIILCIMYIGELSSERICLYEVHQFTRLMAASAL